MLIGFDSGLSAFEPPSPWIGRAAAKADLGRLLTALTLPHRIMDAIVADREAAGGKPR